MIHLPALPYPKNALAPHISEETLNYHYDKHHAGYVSKLNAAIKDTKWEFESLEDMIRKADGGVFNNAAQVWNHTFYWNSMKPNGGGEPPMGLLRTKILNQFGNFNEFKDQFSTAAAGHFGSGWVWLILEGKEEQSLRIFQSHDAGNPMRSPNGPEDDAHPILACDVWEHAYYVDFRNDRPAYIQAWWNLINWDFATQNLEAGCKKLKEAQKK